MINVFFVEDGFEVWIDTEDGEKDGICLGLSETKVEALRLAKDELQGELNVLIEKYLEEKRCAA